MPFNFDEEFGGDDEAVASAAATVVDDLTQGIPDTTPESIDEHMSEVEKRLEVASYYRMLLNDSLFTDATAAGRTVEAEVRAFIRERLAVLLNIKPARPEPVEVKSPFSDVQIQALQALANKVIGKPALIEPVKAAALAPRPPAVRRVETPQPQSSTAPALRQRQAPATPVATASAKPVTPTKSKPGARKPFERRYSEHTKEDGTKVRLDVTGQVRSPASLPMPTGAALSAVTAARAQENLSRLEIVETSGAGSRAGTHLVQTAIAASLVQKENE